MSTRLKIVVFSVTTMLLIMFVVYITTIGLYSKSLLQTIDAELVEDAQRVKQILAFKANGDLDVFSQPDQAILAQGLNRQLLYLIRDGKQQAIRRSAAMIYLETPVILTSETFLDFSFANKKYRLYNLVYPAGQHAGNEDLVIQVVQSLDQYEQQIKKLLHAMLWLLPLPIVLIALGSWWVADRALKPLMRLSKTLTEINAEQLDVRVAVEGSDEVGKIAQEVNGLLHRIEQAFHSLKRFTSDASHELRTPLTTMRTQAEVVLSRERKVEQYKQALGSVLEELDRLEHLSDALLQLTRGDAGIVNLKRELVDISDLLCNWIEHLSTLAEEKCISIHADIELGISLSVDIAIFERMYINILQNAISYTPVDGEVHVSLKIVDDQVCFRIQDTGPGIADEHKQTVFQRFVRLDSTRQLSNGAGLGLAITQWAVECHGGSIMISDHEPHGAIFSVYLPL